MSPADSRIRAIGIFSATTLLVSLAALFLAVLVYPGGSWADREASGFRLLVNYWCDLMRTVAVNGEANAASATLTRGAFVSLAASLTAFWWVAVSRVRSVSLARLAMGSGALASAGLTLTALLPYDALPLAHSVATHSAGGAGFLAAAFVITGHVQSGVRSPWSRALAGGLVLSALANIAVYADVLTRNERDSAILPVVQKVATVFLVLWMASVLHSSLAGCVRGRTSAPGATEPTR